jgi:hypothetical protein
MPSFRDLLPTESADNPVATRYQMNAEFLAMALLESPKVLAEKKRIGEEWIAVVRPSPDVLAEFPRTLDQLAFYGLLRATNSDPSAPELLRTEVPSHSLGMSNVPGTICLMNNPDTIYRIAQVDGGSRYELHGRLSKHPAIDHSISVLSPDLNTLSPPLGNDLIVEQDGSFSVFIDNSPGEPGTNHLKLGPGRSQLLIRDTLRDGSIERPMTLDLVRTNGPPRAPAPTFAELEDRAIAGLQIMLRTALSVEKLIAVEHVNQLAQPVVRSSGGFLATQANNIGHLNIEDDEAFILTIDMGGAEYFGFPVHNRWQAQDNFVSRQSSLNNFQASPNPDGTYTFIVSPKDTGTRNWIDTVGQHDIVLQLRWQGLSAEADSGQGPRIVSQSLVKLSQLSSVLPSSTSYVDADQRFEQLAARKRSFAWMFDR